MLSKELLSSLLPEVTVCTYDSLDSTNSEAKRQIASGIRGPSLYIAREQTAGRGRLGRSFFSPKDAGLYMSLALASPRAMADTVPLTSAAAVAVAEAIESLTPCRVQIKWVNDIYLNGRKICGILTEAVSASSLFLIFGIGLNLSTDAFPEELKARAGSLGGVVDETALAASIIRRLLSYIRQGNTAPFLDAYRSHSLVLGQSVRYIKNGCSYKGLVSSIRDDCALVVERSDGQTEVLSSGEITLRLSES